MACVYNYFIEEFGYSGKTDCYVHFGHFSFTFTFIFTVS